MIKQYLIFMSIFVAFHSAKALTFSAPALETNWQSVVQIRSDGVDTDGSSVPGYCNGTLLSSRVLVTAAHCVLQAQVLHAQKIQIDVGYYKYVQRPDGSTARVGYVSLYKVETPAKYYFNSRLTQKIQNGGLHTQPGPEEDISVVVLDSDLKLDPNFQFGKIISQAEFAGLRNSVLNYVPTVVSINFFAEPSTDTKRMATLNDLSWQSPSYFKSQSQSRVEEGDSGSPVWVRIGKEWKLMAVVKGRAETFFTNWDVFTTTDQNLCDISRSLETSLRSLVCQ